MAQAGADLHGSHQGVEAVQLLAGGPEGVRGGAPLHGHPGMHRAPARHRARPLWDGRGQVLRLLPRAVARLREQQQMLSLCCE